MAAGRPGGLGRGLGALIPVEGGDRGAYREIPVGAVRPNRHQPRRTFDDEELEALAASIRVVGVLQPVLVREAEDGYELIAGERRWRAARRAGLATVPAIIRSTDDRGALEEAVVENLHRVDLNPIDEAAAYRQLIDDFGLSHQEVADRVGRSRAAVTNALRLLQLPPAVQQLLIDGAITAGHARALLGTDDRAYQEALARRVVSEGLSVREVEEAVRARSGPARASRARSRPALRPPGLVELEELLGEHLSTRVRVDMGARRGRLVIEFANLDDLERIYRRMIPRDPGSSGSASAST